MRARGFTLIELLVVIAIIGVLGNVVMSSVRVAREKGKIASMQEDFHSMRTEATNYFESNRGYGSSGTSCTNPGSIFTDPLIARLVGRATTTAVAPAVCANSNTKWVISVPLPNDNNICTDTESNISDAVADTVNIECP